MFGNIFMVTTQSNKYTLKVIQLYIKILLKNAGGPGQALEDWKQEINQMAKLASYKYFLPIKKFKETDDYLILVKDKVMKIVNLV